MKNILMISLNTTIIFSNYKNIIREFFPYKRIRTFIEENIGDNKNKMVDELILIRNSIKRSKVILCQSFQNQEESIYNLFYRH